jgi:GNAT superfamily N-acetyltransferase
MEPGDAAAVREIFAGLGPRSRELRFLAPKPRLTGADLRQLTAVDGHDHVALLAEETRSGRRVGVARFVRDKDDPQVADVAVAVVDDWQHRGVGTVLATALAERAHELGVRRITVAMSVENDAATRLLHRVEGEIERLERTQGVAEFAITLAPRPRARGPRVPRGAVG